MSEPGADLRRYKCGWLTPEQAFKINSDYDTMVRFVSGLPKAELHLHIEGTFEPEDMLKCAKRNGITDKLEGFSGDEAGWCEAQRIKRQFHNLQEFLDLYYSGCDVLKTEEDFYDLAFSYLKRASACNVLHAEIFFDPQTHMIERNKLPISTVINGLHRACKDAKNLSPPVDAHLIMCFLRHRHPDCSFCQPPAEKDEAMKVLQACLDGGHKDQIIGVGLDSGEAGNPPAIFKDVYDKAHEVGLRCVAHAGEEGPASYITDSLDLLGVDRVDHGVRCLEDPAVVARLAAHGIPLTVCPCSNHRLQVVSRFFGGENPVRTLIDKGLKVTLNGDDPAYFFGHVDKYGMKHDGYIMSNYISTARECSLTADELVMLALNSFESSFITPAELKGFKAKVREYCEAF